MARADGTNPPPGHDASASTWPPSTASTGPILRLGDTGTETRPHSLEVERPPGLSARLLLVVGLLFLLVVAASVLGTMAFLSQRKGPEPAPVEHQPKPTAEDTVPVGQGADARPTEEREAAAEEAGAPAGVPSTPTPTEGAGTQGDEIEPEDAPTSGDVEPDAIGADRPDEPAPPDAPPDAPVAPKVPKHETERCVRAREAAPLALDQRKWAEVAKLVKQRECWPPAQQVERVRMHVNVLVELGRFEDCIAAGRKATDPATLRWVEICRKRLPTP